MYKNYGARGVTICDEWLSNFEAFYDWSITNGYGKGLSIDRIDNDKGYYPDNCRWVDMSIQNHNTRRGFELWHDNKWRTLNEIAQIENISYNCAYGCYVVNKKTRLPRKQLYNIDKIRS